MRLSRRKFLAHTAPLTGVPLIPGACNGLFADGPFLHGVASGDPLQTAVILWTRVSLPSGEFRRSHSESVTVAWQIARDPKFLRVITSGTVRTSDEQDFTVKVDAEGLRAGKSYYYRFECLGYRSPIGRTRTLPASGVKRVRLALTSCSNYPFGFFNAYRLIAERTDLDAVLHLGDYLYEYANAEYGDGTAIGRIPEPAHEILTLDDYRQRHAQYKGDPDLQEAHRQHPFITVWDDHETANDAWREGAENHDPLTEGDWQLRRAAAIRADFEWMPIRDPEMDESQRIYRSFAFGELFDLIMLDTRLLGRDEQVADPCDAVAIADPDRQLLGETQEVWFLEQLAVSKQRGARWRLVGQQVMFGQLANVLSQPVCAFNPDQWDGYASARARVLAALAEGDIDNVVILTGDIHSSWALDVTAHPFDPMLYDPATGAGSLAVEFITPAVTSPGIEDPVQAAQFAQLLLATHPHLKFTELNRRGYALLDVTHKRVQAEWYHVTTIDEPLAEESLAAIFQTQSGTNRITPGLEVTTPAANPSAPAP